MHTCNLQGHPGTYKLADRNRNLKFGRFLALCFRNPLAAIGQFLNDFLIDFLKDFLCENLDFLCKNLDFLSKNLRFSV